MSLGARTTHIMGTFCIVALFSVRSAFAGGCVIDEDCDDGRVCTRDLCVFGNCSNTPDDTLCADGLFCNGVETCNTLGSCQPGTPVECDPGQFCDNDLGRCVECAVDADCDDGAYCNGTETCNDGLCEPGSPINCDFLTDTCGDGFCNEDADICDRTNVCDDGNLCTADLCEPGPVCNFSPNYSVTLECCDPATGNTQPLSDGDSCTADVCNQNNGQVTHVVNSCSDGDPCTIRDRCVNNGDCAGMPVDQLACTDDGDCPRGYCSAQTGMCVCASCASDVDCADALNCTTESCDLASGTCVIERDDNVCDTGLFCAQQHCDADLGCIDTDFCTPQIGNPCDDVSTCDDAADDCGGCPPPTVVASGCRYFDVTPTGAPSDSVAIYLEGDCTDPDSGCELGFADFDPSVAGIHPAAASLVGAAVFRTVSNWGTINLRGDAIRPGMRYRVFQVCDDGGVGVVSAGVLVEPWSWGETNNDDLINIDDILNAVDGFLGQFGPDLARSNVDLRNIDDCTPDSVVDLPDILAIVDRFLGQPYPCPEEFCP